MTGEAAGSETLMSIFTIALLRDSGYYAEVNENMADDFQWGKNKGCDFVQNACKATTPFPEFLNYKT